MRLEQHAQEGDRVQGAGLEHPMGTVAQTPKAQCQQRGRPCNCRNAGLVVSGLRVPNLDHLSLRRPAESPEATNVVQNP